MQNLLFISFVIALLGACIPTPSTTKSVPFDKTGDTNDEAVDEEDDNNDADEDSDDDVIEEDNRPYAMGDAATLRETGLYAENSDDYATDVKAFRPRFPLYSDGLEKRRFISLPPETSIDAANTELWKFPVGTRLWKEFRIGSGDGSRLLETRYMEKKEGQWTFATYVWNEEQTAATLWDGQAIEGEGFNIPSYDQCLTCHIQHDAQASDRPDPVLGFSAVQLTLNQMRELRDAEQLENLRLSRTAHAIPARTERERAVIGYMHGNCGHCHNPRRPEFVQPTMRHSFLLDYNIATARTRDDIQMLSLIDQPVFNRNVFIPGAPQDQVRAVVPGRPDRSMLFYRMRHAEGAEMMPKVGVASRDLDFINGQLRPWIQSLPRR